METAFNKVISALTAYGSTCKGGNWSCPGTIHEHGDRNPSLTVSRDSIGVGLHCHAGCLTEDIVTSLGMRMKDLFDEQEPSREVEQYDYCDLDGNLLYAKVRYEPKGFSIKHPSGNGWQPGIGDAKRVPYRLPQLIDGIVAGKTVYVCYADDTEVLTPAGWMFIAELPENKAVAQYDFGTVNFTYPTGRQTFYYDGEMISLNADWCGLLITPDHRVLCRWDKSNPVTIPARDVGQQRWLPVAGVREGWEDGPSPDEARLLAAWQADGVNCPRGFRVGWNLRKDRKKDRLRKLFSNLGIEWKEQVFDSTPEWTYFTVDRREVPLLDLLDDKKFGWNILDWPIESRRVLLHELGHWDGDFTGREGVRFFTADEQCAEVISAIAATTGWGCISRIDQRINRPEQGPQWVINLVPRDWRSLGNKPVRESYNGNVYCLTVPSGYLVTRRNGKVTVCGNCEGEKDANRLVTEGYVATTNFEGAGKWRTDYSVYFEGADVIVIADRDEPGYAHATLVKQNLAGHARSVKLVHSKTENKKDDVSDHLNAGFSVKELVSLTVDTPITKLYNPVNWFHVWKETGEEPEWLFEPILEVGTVNALFGKPGVGKSLITLEMAMTIAKRGRPVVYVDDENRIQDTVERLRAFSCRPEELDKLFMYSFAGLPALDTPDGGQHLAALADRHEAALVILDTTSRLVAGDENQASTYLQLYRCSLVPLKSRGITVLRLDHPGKDDTRGQRGSSAKLGDIDTLWKLSSESEGLFTLEREKSRSGHGEGAITVKRLHNPLRHDWDALESLPVTGEVMAWAQKFDQLGIVRDAGRPTLRAILEEKGWVCSNATLSVVARYRKKLHSALSVDNERTVGQSDDE